MNQEKKQWEKPVLIVIGRGNPEENVLAVCKSTTMNEPGPNTGQCTDKKNNPCRSDINS
jgi:hypothetical protein